MGRHTNITNIANIAQRIVAHSTPWESQTVAAKFQSPLQLPLGCDCVCFCFDQEPDRFALFGTEADADATRAFGAIGANQEQS